MDSSKGRSRGLGRFWRAASTFWSGRSVFVAWNLTLLLVVIVLAQLLVQYLLNQWNRNFFDAVESHDGAGLWMQARLFVPLAATSAFLAATSVWARMTTQRKWREYLLRHVASYWLADGRAWRLDYVAYDCENPEYRLSEDVRIATDAPVDLAMALLASVLTAITFLSVLWNIGGALIVHVGGGAWVIPGYLAVGVVVYSSLFSVLVIIVGRNLTGVVEREIQAEAELRAAADMLRRDGHRAGPNGIGMSGHHAFWTAVHVVLLRWRSLLWQLVRTTIVSHTNMLLAPVVAWFLCLPKFLDGSMSLGELTQAAAAFVAVQGAFNWLVDNYQRLAGWRASAHRVAALLIALDSLDAPPGPTATLADPLSPAASPQPERTANLRGAAKAAVSDPA
jgi:vitamin B12/bleomycin/antimicrobial peptide transport system ATP-binding/permease protein